MIATMAIGRATVSDATVSDAAKDRGTDAAAEPVEPSGGGETEPAEPNREDAALAPMMRGLLYDETARTAATVRRSGAVAASGITWACQGTSCTVTGPWPQPGVSACAALAREVGAIVSYGRQGAMLTTAQIAQCNASPAASPPPPSPPPPPPPPATPGVAITTRELSVIGGADIGVAVAVAPPASITTSELSVVGGAGSGAPTLPGPLAVTTSQLSVVGGP